MQEPFEYLKEQLAAVVHIDEHTLQAHSADKSSAKPTLPKAVVIAERAEDIQKTLEIANQYRIPVTVRAAGTGKSGGAIAEEGGIILSTEKLNRILEIDKQNACIVCEPGVITADIKKAAQDAGLFYPMEPSSYLNCTIGGNIAENAGAAAAIKYGVTGQYVLGLEGFTGDAKPFSFGGKTHKDVAGFDIKKLLIGSEGCLAVISKITLKLIPMPTHQESVCVSFESLEMATDCLTNIARQRSWPSAAEFIDTRCLDAVEKNLNKRFDFNTGNYVLLIRFESDTKAGLAMQIQALSKQLNSYSQVSMFQGNEADYWQARHAISEALKAQYTYKMSEDITVPPASIFEFLNFLRECQAQSPCVFLGFGHLGDGNIHVNLLASELSESDWENEKEKWVPQFFETCKALGGTLSGEHGIGLTKKAYMKEFFSNSEIHIMKGIKKVFDPNAILNPSKVI